MELIDRILDSARTLRDAIESCPPDLARVRPAAGGFAIVEHAWHLLDFEQEGIAVCLRRTMSETDPLLTELGQVVPVALLTLAEIEPLARSA